MADVSDEPVRIGAEFYNQGTLPSTNDSGCLVDPSLNQLSL